MTKDDLVYLKHILDAIVKIEEYSEGMDFEDFEKNHLVQDGVTRQLEIIGEATKRLSSEFRDKNPSIPWKQMAGMRDKLIHDYLGVDIGAVWETVEQDIPEIKGKIEDIIGPN